MKMKNVALSLLAGLSFALSFVLSAGSAFAHDDKYFDSIKSPHGGQTRMAGPYHFELVLKAGSTSASANPVTLYVTDHAGKAISTKGATASLLIVQGKQKITVDLQAQGENEMVGQGNYAATADLKAALTYTAAGKGAEQARFTPFAVVKKSKKPAKSGDDHAHHH